MKYDQESIQDIADAFAENLNVSMSTQQLVEFVDRNPLVWKEISEYSIHDTASVEICMDALTIELVGRGVPVYGGSTEVKEQFWKDLSEAINQKYEFYVKQRSIS